MSVLPLILLPDPILRKTSEKVQHIDTHLSKLIENMLETMYEAPGIGLAAIQVGEPLRLLVVDVSDDKEKKSPLVVINPEILWVSDARSVYEEGCLSIPDYYAEVERPAEIKMRYLDAQGQEKQLHADGLLATCLQHEIDHLNGTLFIDHISKLKRDMVIKKFKKVARNTAKKGTL